MQDSCMTDTIDKIDIRILDALQHDATLTGKRLADLCHVSEATCSRRLVSLKKRGYIEKYGAVLNRKKLGFDVSVYVLITLVDELTSRQKHFVENMRSVANVLTITNISGEYDYLLHLVAENMRQYHEFAETYLVEENHVRKYMSIFEMKLIKKSTVLPLKTMEKKK